MIIGTIGVHPLYCITTLLRALKYRGRGFRNGRRTTGGMFSQRQLVEKRLERQINISLAFVDLEKKPLILFHGK